LFGSLVVLRHPLGQHVSPPVHAGPPLQFVGMVQRLATHVSPVAQGMPQPPQFFGSVVVLVQPVGQHVSVPVQTGPPLHDGGVWQVAPTQVSPVGQGVPQAPQFFGSVSMSVHPEAQH
jgi:hypothetical protein